MNLTSYAGLELFDRYLRRMCLSELIRSWSHGIRLGGDFSVVAMIRVLIGLLVVGRTASTASSDVVMDRTKHVRWSLRA